MLELHEIDAMAENEVERDALPNAGFTTRHEERRPDVPRLACPHPGCRGQLYPELVLEGLWCLRCLLCSREVGEILESDFVVWAGKHGVAAAKAAVLTFLWVRDDTLSP